MNLKPEEQELMTSVSRKLKCIFILIMSFDLCLIYRDRQDAASSLC